MISCQSTMDKPDSVNLVRPPTAIIDKTINANTINQIFIGRVIFFCHCYVNDDWFPRLSPANDDEESMLDQAFDIKKNSRLSCQIPFTEELDGIVLTLAPKF